MINNMEARMQGMPWAIRVVCAAVSNDSSIGPLGEDVIANGRQTRGGREREPHSSSAFLKSVQFKFERPGAVESA
jgi:hypothetical protein